MFSLTLSMSVQHATRLQSELLYCWLSTVQPTLLLTVCVSLPCRAGPPPTKPSIMTDRLLFPPILVSSVFLLVVVPYLHISITTETCPIRISVRSITSYPRNMSLNRVLFDQCNIHIGNFQTT